MNIILHSAKGLQIGQRCDDGYINLTKMAQASDKLIADYLRLETTQAFLNTLSMDMGIPIAKLIQIRKGKPADLQGTWGHPQVAINCGQWCSPEFAVIVSKWVFDWIITAQNPMKQNSFFSSEFFSVIKTYIESSQALNRVIHTAIHQQTDSLREVLKALETSYKLSTGITISQEKIKLDSIEEFLFDNKLTLDPHLHQNKEDNHLFQFIEDAGINYCADSTMFALDIWALLEQWYINKEILVIKKGKKRYWADHINKSDKSVKAPNQVIARFLQLFPQAERVLVPHRIHGVRKPTPAIQGIGQVTKKSIVIKAIEQNNESSNMTLSIPLNIDEYSNEENDFIDVKSKPNLHVISKPTI